MKGYFRTQWLSLFIGMFDIGLFIYDWAIGEYDMALLWLVGAVVWLMMSRVDYNDDRIRTLEKKAEKYDALCDLVEALREANRIDRDHLSLHDTKINCIADYIDKELKR